MKIAILSDTHGRQATLARALVEARERGVTTVIHCGDLDDAETPLLLRGFDCHVVFGNCDLDRDGIADAVAAVGGTLHGDWGTFERAGRRLVFLHGDDAGRMRELLQSEAFDYLFHGHTHQARDETVGRTRVINPGALHRARPKTFVVLDLDTGLAESIIVE
jgi:putative phosphoesterase